MDTKRQAAAAGSWTTTRVRGLNGECIPKKTRMKEGRSEIEGKREKRKGGVVDRQRKKREKSEKREEERREKRGESASREKPKPKASSQWEAGKREARD